jgi:serine protease Do
VVARQEKGRPSQVVIARVDAESPAASSGVQPGDVLTSVGGVPVRRALDVERAFLSSDAGEEVTLLVERDRERLSLSLVLASLPGEAEPAADRTWDLLGLELAAVPTAEFRQYRSRYRGGLSVTDVRPDSPAARQGIRPGDILVGMHIWETVELDNVDYILGRPDLGDLMPMKFYILRGNETLYGHLTLSRRTARSK